MSKRRKECQIKSIWNPKHLGQVVNDRHCANIWLYLIQHPEIKQIKDIPLHKWSLSDLAKKTIENEFTLHTTKIVDIYESARGDTIKLLIELHDGHRIETVIMKHYKRTTVCLSSQVGCQMGCRFCATGTMGIIGDLECHEIIEQLIYANQISPVRNVVFMGMGEPLNNYENTKAAVNFMIDSKVFSLSPKHVTVSTVGVTKNMYRLSNELPHVNLALSLHAPNQILRKQIIPTAGGYPIDKLIEAVTYHIQKNCMKKIINTSHTITSTNNDSSNQTTDKNKESVVVAEHIEYEDRHDIYTMEDNNDINNNTSNCDNNNSISDTSTTKEIRKIGHQGVMIEYILISEVNDMPFLAHELGQLLAPIRDYILLNLIPYNPTEVKEDYKAPTSADIELFRFICISAPYQIHTRVRQEMGQDIAGACGQLVLKKTTEKHYKNTIEIEDFIQSKHLELASSSISSNNGTNNGIYTRKKGTNWKTKKAPYNSKTNTSISYSMEPVVANTNVISSTNIHESIHGQRYYSYSTLVSITVSTILFVIANIHEMIK